MKLVINTEYSELLRFLFKELRYEKSFPIRDNFMLVKQLSHKENRALERFSNYVVVSKTFATEEWGRTEIFEYVKARLKSRRKPSYEIMTDREFIKNMKIFWVTGKWVTEDIESGMFDLYKTLDSKSLRWVEYFKLRDRGVHPMAIFYSLLTFVGKVYDLDKGMSGLKKGYAAVLSSKRRRVMDNFKNAISVYSESEKDVDDDFRVLRFLMDIGGGYHEAI